MANEIWYLGRKASKSNHIFQNWITILWLDIWWAPLGPRLVNLSKKIVYFSQIILCPNEDILLENYDPNTNYEKLGISNGEPLIYL